MTRHALCAFYSNIIPIRKYLDAAVSSQKIIQISGQSRITLLDKYPNSIKTVKVHYAYNVVCCGLSNFFFTCVENVIEKPQHTT
jgi:hypothetical protein